MDKDQFKRRLTEIVEARGLKVATLAREAGVERDVIRDLLRDRKDSLLVENAAMIAAALGMTLDEMLGGSRPAPSAAVAVAGRVGAGARVPLCDAYPKGDGLYHVHRPPQLPENGVVAVEVAGDSMEPVYLDGDVLFYRRDALGVPDQAIGRRCVAEDEAGNVWVKLVRRRMDQPQGLVDLVSFHADAPPMYDVTLRWAAPILMHLPQELVERVDLSAHEVAERMRDRNSKR